VNRTRFFAEFVQKPLSIGALVPSSPYLASMIIRNAGLADAQAVLEYGAGTGGLTDYILRELHPRAKFAAIEINPQLAAIFKDTHPGVPLFQDSAENARAICDSMQVATVDCVVSGLPWAFFTKSLQISILDELMRVLKPGGVFTTFGYLQGLALPAAWNFASLLPNYFRVVSRSSIVWRNVPPAFVYQCRR
jgi:phosphatidylethanolamine/phosphatidyl-N-methylethanolamine N-methyltransferase